MSRPQVIDDEQHERVHERVAAIDVAKDSGMVCTRTPHPSRPGARRSTVWTVRARMGAVRGLDRQLHTDGIEIVTLESTGVASITTAGTCQHRSQSASAITSLLVAPKLRVSAARRAGSLSDGTRIVATSPALPMSMPHTRSRYSGSSVTSSTRPSPDLSLMDC